MTGLREYSRDLTLPGRLGEPQLVPPSTDEVAERLAPRLAPELGPLSRVELTYARWKPGVATTACYRLQAGDSTRVLVTKIHADGKAAALAAGDIGKGRFGDQHEVDIRLIADGDRLAWCFPADRELPGAARVLDVGRFARFFEREGSMPGWRVRRKHITTDLVRYRPESRAVFHLGVKLESQRGEKQRIELGARALRRSVALRVIEQRHLFERSAEARTLAPTLCAAEARSGLLFEHWLPGTVARPGEFQAASQAGSILARLHQLPHWEGARPTKPHDAADALAWLSRDPAVEQATPALSPIVGRPRCWVHGDFHPDQVGTDPDRERTYLLDLDRLGAGDPLDDLAEWIADDLAEGDGARGGLGASAGPLLDAYLGAGGEEPDGNALLDRVRAALVRRAAAAMRRLESDATGRALELLNRARELRIEETAP